MKFKKLFAFLFIFVLLALSCVSVFADDTNFGGENPGTLLYALCPAEFVSIRAGMASTTADLDSIVFSLGGFCSDGDLTKQEIKNYVGSSYGVMTKDITRSTETSSASNTVYKIQQKITLGQGYFTSQGVGSYINNLRFNGLQFVSNSSGSFTTVTKNTVRIEHKVNGSSNVSSVQIRYKGYARVVTFEQNGSDGTIINSYVPFDVTVTNTGDTSAVLLFSASSLNAIDNAIASQDPFGNVYHLLDIQWCDVIYTTSTTVTPSGSDVHTLNIISYHQTEAPQRSIERLSVDVDQIVEAGSPVFISSIPLARFFDNSVGGFLGVDVFGPFSFGDILATLLGLAVFIIILKIFAGG